MTKNGFETIPSKKELEQYFDKKYNTILKKAQQEQKQQELYNIKTNPEAETKNNFTFNWGRYYISIAFHSYYNINIASTIHIIYNNTVV